MVRRRQKAAFPDGARWRRLRDGRSVGNTCASLSNGRASLLVYLEQSQGRVLRRVRRGTSGGRGGGAERSRFEARRRRPDSRNNGASGDRRRAAGEKR